MKNFFLKLRSFFYKAFSNVSIDSIYFLQKNDFKLSLVLIYIKYNEH